MKAHKKRMKIVSILLAFALITQTIPAELFRFFVSWVSAEEIQLPQQDSYVIPQESPVNLEIEIPPTFVEGEDYVPAEEEITIPDSSEIASTDDDIRYGTILQTYTAYSQLSSEDAAFFVEYTGVSASDFTTMETGGLNLSRSVKYGMLAGAFGCELSKIMEIAPTQTEYNDLYRQITIYHSAIRVELLSEAQNATIKDYILEGYSCNEVCNAVVVNEITGIPVNQLLSDETAQVPSGTSPAVLNASTNFANKFSVSPNAVVNNAAENDWSTDDVQGYQEDVDSRLAQIKGVTSTGSETPPEGEEGAVQDPFLGAPYVYSENDTEQISFNTGSLSYTQVDYILPGINGLDLTIGRRYQSQDASIYTPYLDYDMVETDKYMVIFLKTVTRYPGGDMDNGILERTHSYSDFYYSLRSAQSAIKRWEGFNSQRTDHNGDVVVTEYWTTEPVLVTVEEEESYSTTIPNSYNKDLYGLGHGWSFLFSSIESGRYLHLSDGSCYMTDFYGSSPSHLKDYTLTDKVMDRFKSPKLELCLQ